MAVDKIIPTSPPPNTTMAYFAGQVQEELTGLWNYAPTPVTATGTNTLVGVATPVNISYVQGQNFVLSSPTANTGAMTLDIDGLGAMPLVKPDGSAFVAGDVDAGAFMFVHCDLANSRFVVIGGAGGGTNIPQPTQQYEVLQADASLNWVASNQIFSGNF